MKQHEAKQFIPIIQAWADGKTIQWRETPTSSQWHDYSNKGSCNFSGSADEYRIKPEPKLRAWKPEEVPVGALYKWQNHVAVILSVADGQKLCFLDRCGKITWNFLDAGVMCEESKHSLDGGKTWFPCGVMEGAQ